MTTGQHAPRDWPGKAHATWWKTLTPSWKVVWNWTLSHGTPAVWMCWFALSADIVPSLSSSLPLIYKLICSISFVQCSHDILRFISFYYPFSLHLVGILKSFIFVVSFYPSIPFMIIFNKLILIIKKWLCHVSPYAY